MAASCASCRWPARRTCSCTATRRQLMLRRYMQRPGSELYQLPMASKARLVLHFDINKTVLMADRAQGASSACVINMLLSECAWGRLEAGPQWVPVGRLATDR